MQSVFIQYHLDVMKKAFGELKKYLQRKIDEQQNILRFAGAANINERQRYVIRTISESKRILFTPKELATQFDISTRTARTDLQELVEMGYLNTTNLNKRAIGYIKSERFESLLNNLIKKDKGNQGKFAENFPQFMQKRKDLTSMAIPPRRPHRSCSNDQQAFRQHRATVSRVHVQDGCG